MYVIYVIYVIYMYRQSFTSDEGVRGVGAWGTERVRASPPPSGSLPTGSVWYIWCICFTWYIRSMWYIHGIYAMHGVYMVYMVQMIYDTYGTCDMCMV